MDIDQADFRTETPFPVGDYFKIACLLINGLLPMREELMNGVYTVWFPAHLAKPILEEYDSGKHAQSLRLFSKAYKVVKTRANQLKTSAASK